MRFCFLTVLLALVTTTPLRAESGWRPPAPERTVLPNGLAVLCLHRPESQVVTVSAMIRAGSASDPDSLPGLAHFTALMLSRGSRGLTAEQVSSRIDFVGADLSPDCDRDASFLTMTCLARDLDSLLPVFFSSLIRPSFDSLEVEISRREILSSLRVMEDRHRQVSEEAFDSLLYGPHPYGHPVPGRPESVGRISPSHLNSFHGARYLPNNASIAFVGPFPSSRVLPRVRRLVAGWKAGRPPETSLPQVSPPEAPRALFIHRPISQAYITLGFLGPSRGDPDYQSARLMNYILGGGGFSSRLTKSIRVRHGLAYDVDASFEPRLGQGPYRFAVQTKTSSADTAFKLVLCQLRKMLEEPVDSAELREAKDYLLGSYPFRFETGTQVARQFLMLELYRLDLGYFSKDIDLTEKASALDLLVSAQRLLKPGNFVLSVVGDTTSVSIDVAGQAATKR